MGRTLIAVWGPSNVGKTTAIRLAYDELRFTEGVLTVDPGYRARKEVRGAILEIDGVKIGFASPGDTAEVLESYLSELTECDVIVCASHTPRSKTFQVLRKYARGRELRLLQKSWQSIEQEAANRQMADRIKREVYRAVKKALLVEV